MSKSLECENVKVIGSQYLKSMQKIISFSFLFFQILSINLFFKISIQNFFSRFMSKSLECENVKVIGSQYLKSMQKIISFSFLCFQILSINLFLKISIQNYQCCRESQYSTYTDPHFQRKMFQEFNFN